MALESNSVVAGLRKEALRQALAQAPHGSAGVARREQRSLRRNLAWTMAGDGVHAASQWGMLIVIAKLGNAEMLGQFALGLAITAPVIFLAGLSLRAILATDMRSEYEFGEYLALRLMTTVGALTVIAGLTLVAKYSPDAILVILCIGLAKAFETISDIYYGLFQQRERMDFIAISLMLKGPLSLAALVMTLFLWGNIVWAVAAMAAVWCAVLIAYDMRVGTRFLRDLGQERTARPQWQMPRLARLMWTAWPLGCTLMLLSLNFNMPRYFVEHYFGEHQLGIFAALAHLMLAGSIVVNAFGQTVSPRLARYWAEGTLAAYRALLYKLLAVVTVLGMAGVVVALTVGHELLTLLYQPEYTAAFEVFVWLMLVAAVSHIASALGYGLTAARILWLQPLQLGCATAAGTIACLLLIPAHGLKGAAWAMGISFIVQLAIAIAGLGYALYKTDQGRRQISPPVPAG